MNSSKTVVMPIQNIRYFSSIRGNMSEQTEWRRLQFQPSSGSNENAMEMAHITLKAMTALVFVMMRLYAMGLWMDT